MVPDFEWKHNERFNDLGPIKKGARIILHAATDLGHNVEGEVLSAEKDRLKVKVYGVTTGTGEELTRDPSPYVPAMKDLEGTDIEVHRTCVFNFGPGG